jgi:hypothetical protein
VAVSVCARYTGKWAWASTTFRRNPTASFNILSMVHVNAMHYCFSNISERSYRLNTANFSFPFRFLGSFAKQKNQLLASSWLPVRPHRTNRLQLGQIFIKFDVSIFRKFSQKIKMSLKSDKNNGYFTWQPMYIYDISPISSQNEKCFTQKLQRIAKHTFYVQ